MPKSIEAEPILHPSAAEPWFKALPREKQDEFHRACLNEASRRVEVEHALRGRYLRGAVQAALAFGAFDYFCPGGGVPSLCLALVVGAGIGVAFERINADRIVSGAGALVAFFLFEWFTRSGLSALHMFLIFPVGAFCALQGLRRENGD